MVKNAFMLDFQDFQIYEIHCDYFVGADKVQTLDKQTTWECYLLNSLGFRSQKELLKCWDFD